MDNSDTRGKRLFKDTILFAISSFGSKIIVFLMLPLYTNVLTTNEYGTADLLQNVVNLIYPLLTLGLVEAIIRFCFEKKADKGSVLTSTLAIAFFGTTLLVCASVFKDHFGDVFSKYWDYFILLFATHILYLCFSYFCKAIDRLTLFAVQGILFTVVYVLTNLLFLLGFKIGLRGYILSSVVANIFTSIFLFFVGRFYRFIKPESISIQLIKEMLKFSIPLIPTIVAWWMNASLDKYFIIYYSGIPESGVYSVAHKIPSILNAFTAIFASAWELSALRSMDDDDKSRFYTKTYNNYYVLLIIGCSAIVLSSQFLGYVLFSKEYYIAWTFVPCLLVSSVFAGLSGFTASIFRTYKKTINLMVSVLIGAFVNCFLNYLLIMLLGTMGACLATMISFFVVWIIRELCLRRIIKLKTHFLKWIISFAILSGLAVYFGYNMPYKYIVGTLALLAVCLTNFKEIKDLIGSVKLTFFKRKSNK